MMVISRSADDDKRKRALEDSFVRVCGMDGIRVILTPHLYHLPDPCPMWDQLLELPPDSLFVTWMYPRPFEWLLRRHGITVDSTRIFQWGSGSTAKKMLATIHKVLPARPDIGGEPLPPCEWVEPVRARWYPVIDGARCINCRHCLQFCLFNVYETDAEGRVVVRNPDNCKPGCPACSRICPQGAIMFPLYEQDDAIAGAPGRFVTPDAAARRMYYGRTGRACPVCGVAGGEESAVDQIAAPEATCPECGRPRPGSSPSNDTFNEIDDLINRLDDFSRRNG